MGKYRPIISLTPPAAGSSKMFWSPEMFDSETGNYPTSNKPSVSTYPMVLSVTAPNITFWPSGDRTVTSPKLLPALTNPSFVYDEKDAPDFTTCSDSTVSAIASSGNYDGVYSHAPDGAATEWVKTNRMSSDFIFNDPSGRSIINGKIIVVYDWTGIATPIGTGTTGGPWGGSAGMSFQMSLDGGTTFKDMGGGEWITPGVWDSYYGRGVEGAPESNPVVVSKKTREISFPVVDTEVAVNKIIVRATITAQSEATSSGNLSKAISHMRLYALYLVGPQARYDRIQFFEGSKVARIWPNNVYANSLKWSGSVEDINNINDEQDKNVIDGKEVETFTTAATIYSDMNGSDVYPSGSGGLDSSTFTEDTSNQYLVCGFGAGTITDPIVSIVFSAELYATAIEVTATSSGGIHSGTYSGFASLYLEYSLDDGATWNDIHGLGGCGSAGKLSGLDNGDSLSLAKALVSSQRITGTVNLATFKVRINAQTTGISMWYTNERYSWRKGDSAGASVTATVYALYLE